MSERIVINTGPLISLAAGNVLHLLKDLPYEFLVPREVQLEIETGEHLGRGRVDLSHVTIVESAESLDMVTFSLLDKGEASVIELALRNRIDTVCIDEKKGRRFARAVNLEVMGTLALLLKAKKIGILDAVAPVIDRQLGFGIWYNSGLLQRVLSFAGETLPLVPGKSSDRG